MPEDPDEKLHIAAYIRSTLFARQKQSSEKERQFYLEILACDPSNYTMDHPKFIVSNKKEESIYIVYTGLIKDLILT